MPVTPENKPIPATHHEVTSPWKTVLAFDFGRRRIGVAVGESITGSARPLSTLPTRRQRPDWEAISRLLVEWCPDRLVVGVPRHADGTANAITEAALRFSRQLHGRFHLPVETIDERLSSWEAAQRRESSHHRQRDNAVLDAAAAAVILESWINQTGVSPRA